MPVSVHWPSRVITVPLADLTPLSAGVYGLNVDTFRLALKSLEDDPAGMPYPDTHRHNTAVTLGGVTLARTVELVNDYTVTFEDGQYAVVLSGANNNIADVTNVNQVSVRSNNSAGLVQTEGGSMPTANEVADAVHAKVIEGGLDLAAALRVMIAFVAGSATGLDADGGAVAFKSLDGAKNRIEGTISPVTGARTVTSVDGA